MTCKSYDIINQFNKILYEDETTSITTKLEKVKEFIEENAKLGLIEWKINKYMGVLYCKSNKNNKKHNILYKFIRPTQVKSPDNHIKIENFICHFKVFGTDEQMVDTKIYFKHTINGHTEYIPIFVRFPEGQVGIL